MTQKLQQTDEGKGKEGPTAKSKKKPIPCPRSSHEAREKNK
jgi:hypothetical protein